MASRGSPGTEGEFLASAMGKLERFTVLFHHRWGVAVLADLHRGGGRKFVTMVNRLGVSRGALRQTLDALIEHGWVVRNPGYGHPLRPEYLLTAAGARVARVCVLLQDALRSLRVEDVGLRKWTLAVIYALHGGSRRFGEVRTALRGVTDRALALALKELQAAGLVERTVRDEYPPAPLYLPTPTAQRLMPILQQL